MWIVAIAKHFFQACVEWVAQTFSYNKMGGLKKRDIIPLFNQPQESQQNLNEIQTGRWRSATSA